MSKKSWFYLPIILKKIPTWIRILLVLMSSRVSMPTVEKSKFRKHLPWKQSNNENILECLIIKIKSYTHTHTHTTQTRIVGYVKEIVVPSNPLENSYLDKNSAGDKSCFQLTSDRTFQRRVETNGRTKQGNNKNQ